MYRYARVEIGAASDSSLQMPTFGPLKAFFDQIKDLQQCGDLIRVAPGASQAQVSLSPVTTGYFLLVLSDYPVQVAVNGTSPNMVFKSNNVAATNFGSPLPDQCCLLFTGQVTSLYLTPISGATQTANVKVFCSGDPTNTYT